jgi:hypothetical protein
MIGELTPYRLSYTVNLPIPSHIEIPVHLLGTVVLLAVVLVLRALIDLEMGVWVVRLLHWVPTRWLFRHRYIALKGQWEHIWNGEVGHFQPATARHGQHYMYQLFRWVYARTRSQGKVFTAFGRIQGDYLIGRWYDNTDEAGYFGAFQLRIIDSRELQGKWIGHSKRNPGQIGVGTWSWKRVHE